MKTERSSKNSKTIFKILIYIFLVIAAVYTLTPFFTILLTSFRSSKDVYRGPFTWPHEWSIVANYKKAWEMAKFGNYFFNSVYMAVLAVIGTLLVATLAGYSFAKLRYPGKKFLYYLLLVSMMIPFQTIMIPNYFVLRSINLLDTRTGISILSIATGIGFAVMMMRSFFISFPDSILESARLDGCSELQILARIVLPNTFPAWSSLIIFVAWTSWNNLLAPMMYIFKEAKYPIPYGLYAFSDAHSTTYELLAAAMVISILPLAIVYILFSRYFQTNIFLGSVKG